MTSSVSDRDATRMKQAAESLVLRARSGDQNAIGMIVKIKQEVPSSRRAALAYDMLVDYVKQHPITESVRFGLERAAASTARVSAVRGAREATRVGVPAERYVKVVRWIECCSQNIDALTLVACAVADGRDVDERVVARVIPHLRGSLAMIDGKPVPLTDLRKSGTKVAGDWQASFGADGLELHAGGSCVMGVDGGSGTAEPSAEMFARAFDSATQADDVLTLAAPVPRNQRQPIRVGYVLGLARAIQGVTRRDEPLSVLSDYAEAELGD